MKNALLILVVSILISCASDKPTGKTEAEVLYKEAKILVEDERYLLATEKLNDLKNQYPYSFYATPAELLQADIFFLQENFIESAAAYMIFRDLHPKHAKAAYVLFRIAESYFYQLPSTFDRDLESANRAIQFYQELIVRYPQSSYVKEAKEKIEKAHTMLVKKEKYVADFYFKTKLYSAARWRFLEILAHFNDKKIRDYSMERIVASSFYLKEYGKCLEYTKKYSSFLKNKELKEEVQRYTELCKKSL